VPVAGRVELVASQGGESMFKPVIAAANITILAQEAFRAIVNHEHRYLARDLSQGHVEEFQSKAFAERFKLVCRQAKTSCWNSLACHRRRKSKDEKPYCCQFCIRTEVMNTRKENAYCQVTNFCLEHNHSIDPVFFANRLLATRYIAWSGSPCC
jgi:hypothetical protein